MGFWLHQLAVQLFKISACPAMDMKSGPLTSLDYIGTFRHHVACLPTLTLTVCLHSQPLGMLRLGTQTPLPHTTPFGPKRRSMITHAAACCQYNRSL